MKKTLTARTYNQTSYILPASVMAASLPVTRITQTEQDIEEQGYLEWKRQNNLPERLSRQEFEILFNIYA